MNKGTSRQEAKITGEDTPKQKVESMGKGAAKPKEILDLEEQLRNQIGELEEGLDILEESLVQVLGPLKDEPKDEKPERQVPEREVFVTPLGERLDTLVMYLQSRNARLSNIINRLEV